MERRHVVCILAGTDDDFKVFRRLNMHFLVPTSRIMADLKMNLEKHRIQARTYMFLPVYTVETECQDVLEDICTDSESEDRQGFILEGSAQADRQAAQLSGVYSLQSGLPGNLPNQIVAGSKPNSPEQLGSMLKNCSSEGLP